ncbi:MAG: hypothetical protein U5K69_15725 [Balneolaceae bacterium]|nr:hypothetical protein [Balneolaceae bacterium]
MAFQLLQQLSFRLDRSYEQLRVALFNEWRPAGNAENIAAILLIFVRCAGNNGHNPQQ